MQHSVAGGDVLADESRPSVASMARAAGTVGREAAARVGNLNAAWARVENINTECRWRNDKLWMKIYITPLHGPVNFKSKYTVLRSFQPRSDSYAKAVLHITLPLCVVTYSLTQRWEVGHRRLRTPSSLRPLCVLSAIASRFWWQQWHWWGRWGDIELSYDRYRHIGCGSWVYNMHRPTITWSGTL